MASRPTLSAPGGGPQPHLGVGGVTRRERAALRVARDRRPRGGGAASNRLGPIAATLAASGATVRTSAPRRRRISVSARVVARVKPRIAPSRSNASRGVAVGSRQSTALPRRTGAASRFAALQTPPSTYVRPPISTGRNIHGTAHEASTASTTSASGAPGAPNTTRRPLARSTAVTRSRPSKRAPRPVERLAQARDLARRRAPRAQQARRAAAARAGTSPAATAGATGSAAERAARPTAPRSPPAGPSLRRRRRPRPPPPTPPRPRPRRPGAAPRRAPRRRSSRPTCRRAPRRRRGCQPVASASPARHERIHASPSTPPPPRTSTSGRIGSA